MRCWLAKANGCCISCSSYGWKAANRLFCCARQRELLLLVNLKRQSAHTPLRTLFDKHRVWQNRRQLLSDALARLSTDQLRQAVTLLTRAELTFKQDYGSAIWPELESLSLLLCHKALADVFIDG
jgi:DNA polymerase-3 subunit delta